MEMHGPIVYMNIQDTYKVIKAEKWMGLNIIIGNSN